MFIKNFDELAKTPQRKVVLELIETALGSIQSENAINKSIEVTKDILTIKDKSFDLSNYERVFLIGFGKGSAKNSKLIEEKLREKLTEGYVIDTNPEDFKKIKFTQGTHPLPSQANVGFTDGLIKRFREVNLTEKDLVLIVVCGGGSAMLVHPAKISLDRKIEIEKALLKSGADIMEMNTIRQHLSTVKGGGLAELLYPASVASLIFSDVPGNNLSFIASGPTVKDDTSIKDALSLLEKYDIKKNLNISEDEFVDNPKDEKYFANASNILVLSNLSALSAMGKKAEQLGYTAEILSDRFEGEARNAGQELIGKTNPASILLAGGETTVKVTGSGIGGRNQEVVLGALSSLDQNTLIASFATDGWDNSELAGALGDVQTLESAKSQNLDIEKYLDENNSLEFFEKTGDGIKTDRLPSNVSDLFIVFKY